MSNIQWTLSINLYGSDMKEICCIKINTLLGDDYDRAVKLQEKMKVNLEHADARVADLSK